MSSVKIRNPRDILLAPVVSEKSYGLLDENKYTFLVAPEANKTEIKIAVETVFKVQVTSVNTLNRPGKKRRTARYAKLNDAEHALLAHDFKNEQDTMSDHPLRAYWLDIVYPQVIVPKRLPPLGLGGETATRYVRLAVGA